MRILVLAYYFPPFGGGASERVHHFVKNLPRFDIIPIVITVRSEFYEGSYSDASLEAQYQETVEIVRTPMFFGQFLKKQKDNVMTTQSVGSGSPKSLLFRIKRKLRGLLVPDEQVLWQPHAYRACKKVIKRADVDAILSTGAPFSSHFFASILSKVTKLPLILDYRDLWTENVIRKGGVGEYINQKMERFALRQASSIIFTNDAAAEATVLRFNLDRSVVEIVANGYDAEALARLKSSVVRNTSEINSIESRPIRINYIGSLTRHRSPGPFFEALLSLKEHYVDLNVRVNFFGYATLEHNNLADSLGLDHIVTFKGVVSKEESLRIMCQGSDVLLVLQRDVEGGGTAIPGKVYEYLASGIPVLCLDQNCGPTSKLLKQLGSSLCADYDDIADISMKLDSLLSEYDKHLRISVGVIDKVHHFERVELTGQLSRIITRVSKSAPAN